MSIEVTFWGARGSVATPGRPTEKYGGNTACVSVKIDNKYFIFDAGTGLRQLGQDILAENDLSAGGSIEIHLFLSHTHWDHIQGLPFFEPAYTPGVHLKIYGRSRRGRDLATILGGQMDKNYFPVPMSALGAKLDIVSPKEKVFQIGDVTVSFEELNHPGGCIGVRLEYEGKSVAYATDNELDCLYEDADRLDEIKNYKDFIRDLDLLIADGQYTAEEYVRCRGWGHSTADCMLSTAYDSGVKTVAVFHHDPMHTDSFLDTFSSDLIKKYRNGKERSMTIFWAREQMAVPVR